MWIERLLTILVIVSFYMPSAFAVEVHWRGVADLRLSATDSSSQVTPESFLNGDYGKFRYSENTQLSLSQLSFNLDIDWENNFSLKVISNAYLTDERNNIGITEAFIKYQGLPNNHGVKFQWRAGIFYPKVSMENFATSWNSPYSLTYSHINSWIGEEVRHAGVEFSIDRLGKFNQSNNDFRASLALFQNNDTTGALLAWHGWNLSSRQTLWSEEIKLPNQSVRETGAVLDEQADWSKPFVEIDNRTGYHLTTEWRFKKRLKVLSGYYDNRAKPYIRINGQYAWHTRFFHFGFNWKIQPDLTLIGQTLNGDTLMQSPLRQDVVNNQFSSAFLLLSKRWQQHRLSGRVENFSVTDKDNTYQDNNAESGHSLTLSYVYRLNRHWFVHTEYSRINSKRFSRTYHHQSEKLHESLLQFAVKRFF